MHAGVFYPSGSSSDPWCPAGSRWNTWTARLPVLDFGHFLDLRNRSTMQCRLPFAGLSDLYCSAESLFFYRSSWCSATLETLYASISERKLYAGRIPRTSVMLRRLLKRNIYTGIHEINKVCSYYRRIRQF